MPISTLCENCSQQPREEYNNNYTNYSKKHYNSSIFPHHRQEWEASAIAPELIELNLRTIPAHQEALNPWEEEDIPEAYYLLYPKSDDTDRQNTGRVRDKELRRIRSPHIVGGGWFSSGYDLRTGKRSTWGTYKPDTPRWDANKGKYQKYEHPAGVPTETHVPAIPLFIADQWLGQYDGWQQFKENYQGEKDFTAWAFMLERPDIPLNITEGNKKTNSLVTHYGMTIGLVGIWNWKDQDAPRHFREDGSTYREPIITRYLNPFLTEGRRVNIWFDEDEKPKTRKDVRKASLALGEAIEKLGCEVNVACWDSENAKGIDDAIASHGTEFLEKIQWYDLDAYRNRGVVDSQHELNSLTHPIDLRLDAPRLPDLKDSLPDRGIIALKSAKGTGKSWQIKEIIKDSKAKGKAIISITPRIALGRSQAIEWDIEWIDDVGRIHQEISIGACWDSLQKVSHLDWSNRDVIIDESELGTEHLLASSTCKDRRAKLLRIFEAKIKECLGGTGRVILSDADQTDIPIDYIKGIAPDAPLYIVENDAPPALWKGLFSTGKVDESLEMLFEDIENGEKLAIATDSQSQAEALAKDISLRYPDILIDRVDGKTTQDDYGREWIKKPNESISLYLPDILIYTPSMGVGVSITKEHFSKVYGFFHGVLAPSQCRQMLARVRLPIPRVIWCMERGMISGGAPLTPKAVKNSIHKNVDEGLSLSDLVNAIGPDNQDLEGIYQVITDIRNGGQWDNVHLDTYAKLKARRNYGLNQLAVQLREELKEEGHEIIDFYSSESTGLGDALRDGKEKLKEEEATAIANAEDISIEEAQDMSYKHSLTEEERHKMQKAFIREELPEADLTPDFILKAVVQDKRRWLNGHKLFWFLQNPYISKYLDHRELIHHAKQFSEGVTFLPDIRTISPKIKLLEDIGLMGVLQPDNLDKIFTNGDEELKALHEKCYSQRERMKRVLGISVGKELAPMQLLKMLAEKIGINLFNCDRKRVAGKVIRIYQIDQEELVTPHRIEVLNALDRKGEAICQKAQSDEVIGCDTPPSIVNKIGGGVTAIYRDREDAIECAEMVNDDAVLSLGERFSMIYQCVADAGGSFLTFLKRYVTDPIILEELNC